MFAAQESRLVRTAALGISLIIHLLFFLIFPHLSTFFEGASGEAIMAGGVPVQLVTVTPVASSVSRPTEKAAYGRTEKADVNRTLPAPDEPSTHPQPDQAPGVMLQSVTPASPAAPLPATPESATATKSAGMLQSSTPGSAQASVKAEQTGLPATPTNNSQLLTSPKGTDVLQMPEYSAKDTAGVTESKSANEAPVKSSPTARSTENTPETVQALGNKIASATTDAVPKGQTSQSGGELRRDAQGASGKQGTGDEASAPPAPSVGQGPWLAGSAPVYPKTALDRGIEGVVRGQVLVSSDGKITVRQTASAGNPSIDLVASKTIAERWQAAYRPPAGWVTVVEWVVRFERNQVFVEQPDAFNVREDQVPATGPVQRSSAGTTAGTSEGGAR